MELPKRPELEKQEKVGQYGEIVIGLTPESEKIWSDYLTRLHFAKIALRSINGEQEDA